MKEKKDMQPFERAMRLKLGLEPVPSKPVPVESKPFSTGSTVAQDMLRIAHPDLSDEDLELLGRRL